MPGIKTGLGGHLRGRMSLSIITHWNICRSALGSPVQTRLARKATRLNAGLVARAVLASREVPIFYLW